MPTAVEQNVRIRGYNLTGLHWAHVVVIKDKPLPFKYQQNTVIPNIQTIQKCVNSLGNV